MEAGARNQLRVTGEEGEVVRTSVVGPTHRPITTDRNRKRIDGVVRQVGAQRLSPDGPYACDLWGYEQPATSAVVGRLAILRVP